MLKEKARVRITAMILIAVKAGNYITTRTCMEIQKLQMTGSGMMCRRDITSSVRAQL